MYSHRRAPTPCSTRTYSAPFSNSSTVIHNYDAPTPLRGSSAASLSDSAPVVSDWDWGRGDSSSKLPVRHVSDCVSQVSDTTVVIDSRITRFNVVRGCPVSLSTNLSILASASTYICVLFAHISTLPRFQAYHARHGAHSPLLQAQQQVSLWTLRETRDAKEARSPVSILVFPPCADRQYGLREISSGRCRLQFRLVCKTANHLHLCERTRCGGGEGAGGERCALHRAEALHRVGRRSESQCSR